MDGCGWVTCTERGEDTVRRTRTREQEDKRSILFSSQRNRLPSDDDDDDDRASTGQDSA
jgi:hypothetical protein